MTPFQQVRHYDHKPTFELAAIAAPHTFNLLSNIGNIYRGEFTRAQKTALLYCPTVKILFIVNGVPGHYWSPRLPSHATTTLPERAASVAASARTRQARFDKFGLIWHKIIK